MINKLLELIKKAKYNEIIKIINDSKKNNSNINFNFKFENDNYFIEYVLNSKNFNLIKLVLKENISLDITTSDGYLILHDLIKFYDDKNKKIIELILNSNSFTKSFGINLLEKQDLNQKSVFHYCVSFNNIDALQTLINKYLKKVADSLNQGLNFIEELVDFNGDNIFFMALKMNRIDIVKYLLALIKSNNHILKTTNLNNENLLNISIILESPFSDYIINNSLVDFSQKTLDNNYTCYHLASISKNQWKAISRLFEKSIDKFIWSETDVYGNNILHLAIENMNLELITIIFNYIKNTQITTNFMNHTNLKGFTPLHLLLYSFGKPTEDIINICNSMIQFTDLNIQNIYGDTIIHTLLKRNIFSNFYETIKTKEINIFIQNKNEITPFELIQNYGDINNSKILDAVYESYFNQIIKEIHQNCSKNGK